MRRHQSQPPPIRNRWRGFVLGLLGGIAGTVAMGGYWRLATAVTGGDPRAATRDGGPHPLDDISLVGTHHTPEESSTAAIGRLAYARLAGQPPEQDETKSALSYVVHYGFGAVQGGLFGAFTAAGSPARSVAAGPAFGTAVWLGADELGVSLLGLADGPAKYPVSQHLHRWGAHLAYGLGFGLATAALRRAFGETG